MKLFILPILSIIHSTITCEAFYKPPLLLRYKIRTTFCGGTKFRSQKEGFGRTLSGRIRHDMGRPISETENPIREDFVRSQRERCRKLEDPEPESPKFILPGVVMGLPLNFLTFEFMNYYYNSDNVHLFPEFAQIVTLNFLVGTYTYGMDRMVDAVEWGKITNISSTHPNPKSPMYKYILENYDILKNIYDSTYWMFGMILMATPEYGIRPQSLLFLILYESVKFSANLRYTFFSYYLGINEYRLYTIYAAIGAIIANTRWFDHELGFLPFLLALDSAKYYPSLKKRAGLLKAPYVGAMWTGAIAIIPTYLHDHTYHVLCDPKILVPFLAMTAFSNLIDLKDVNEDRANGINTIPVLFGESMTIFVSLIWMSIAGSFLLNFR